jgi:multidrug efflux pump subunit AcrA (membrane-fusion protein)
MVKLNSHLAEATPLQQPSLDDKDQRDRTPPPIAPRPPRWQRVLVGGLCLTLGLGAVAAGLSSIYYRLTHMTVNDAVINGRVVRVQAPIDGQLQDFYGRAGVPVQAEQVLATLAPLAQSDQDAGQLTTLQGQIAATALDLELAEQALALLRRQQGELERQDQQLQSTTVAIATQDLSRYQAALDEASAQEAAARTEYERYQLLFQEGAVSALSATSCRPNGRQRRRRCRLRVQNSTRLKPC